jgi:uncharacterized protein
MHKGVKKFDISLSAKYLNFGIIQFMKKTFPVVHFELPYENSQRMTDFYSKAFGWESQMLGPNMGNYVVVSTSETDEKTQLPKELGMINGGFFEKTKEIQAPSIVIGVDDIREVMKQVAEAGGKVLGGRKGNGEPDDIPGVGLYASVIDTEGNRVGLLQAVGRPVSKP